MYLKSEQYRAIDNLSPSKLNFIMPSPAHMILSVIIGTVIMNAVAARALTPPEEPRDDSYYICYEKRFPNTVTHALLPNYTTYKYIGCTISRLPCQLYCGDKFHARPEHLRQFQWMDTYPKALNSFYRCAYS